MKGSDVALAAALAGVSAVAVAMLMRPRETGGGGGLVPAMPSIRLPDITNVTNIFQQAPVATTIAPPEKSLVPQFQLPAITFAPVFQASSFVAPSSAVSIAPQVSIQLPQVVKDVVTAPVPPAAVKETVQGVIETVSDWFDPDAGLPPIGGGIKALVRQVRGAATEAADNLSDGLERATLPIRLAAIVKVPFQALNAYLNPIDFAKDFLDPRKRIPNG